MPFRAIAILTFSLSLFLSGCQFEKLYNAKTEATEAIQNINTEVEKARETVEQIQKSAEAVKSAYGAVQEARNAVENAVDEVGKLGDEGSTETPTD